MLSTDCGMLCLLMPNLNQQIPYQFLGNPLNSSLLCCRHESIYLLVCCEQPGRLAAGRLTVICCTLRQLPSCFEARNVLPT